MAREIHTTTTIHRRGVYGVALRCGLPGQDAILGNYAGGIILIVDAIPRGICKKNCKCPSTGTRPGIRSIGLTAYPTRIRLWGLQRDGHTAAPWVLVRQVQRIYLLEPPAHRFNR
jgi:hypothetical protein